MARVLYDAEGNAVEGLPDDNELKELRDTKTAKEAADLRIKELEEEANPNFAALRIARKNAEDEAKKWREKAQAAGVKDEPAALPPEDYKEMAKKEAQSVVLGEYTEGLLDEYGEKREIVEDYFKRLSAGQTLTKAKIAELVNSSANAAGINVSRAPNPLRRSMNMTGAPPRFEATGETDFADTEGGQSLAKAMGLKFPNAKKK